MGQELLFWKTWLSLSLSLPLYLHFFFMNHIFDLFSLSLSLSLFFSPGKNFDFVQFDLMNCKPPFRYLFSLSFIHKHTLTHSSSFLILFSTRFYSTKVHTFLSIFSLNFSISSWLYVSNRRPSVSLSLSLPLFCLFLCFLSLLLKNLLLNITFFYR